MLGSLVGYIYGLLLVGIYARVLFLPNPIYMTLFSILRIVALGLMGYVLHSAVNEPILLLIGFIVTFFISIVHKAWYE